MISKNFEHTAVIPPRLRRNVPRLDDIWFERFATARANDIADIVGGMYTMQGIRPLTTNAQRAVGQAVTARIYPGNGTTVLGAYAMAGANDILVIDAWGDVSCSYAGFNAARTPRDRGLKGIIVDGGLRDQDEFDDVGFPVFGRAVATSASAKGRAGDINLPVSCGGVIVNAGDLVIADQTGIAVIPAEYLEQVWEVASRPPSDVYGPDIYGVEKRRLSLYEQAFEAAGGIELAD